VSLAAPIAVPALAPAAASGMRHGLAYGALGLPLAFVALPLYVVLPNHYATVFGVPLATLGALLLATRLLDAFADPWIGRWADGWFAHSARRVLAVAAIAALVLALGFHALFFPRVSDPAALLAWCGAFLAVTYLSYSVLSVVHQAWGARLGGDATHRARIVAWREGLALAGVLVASVLPSLAGLGVTSTVFALALAAGVALLTTAPRSISASVAHAAPSMRLPLTNPGFRRLLLVFMVNGVAGALPATLVLFFIRDRLQLPAYEPLFLFSYFAAGALSMPLWVRAVARFGLSRSWLGGMLLAIMAFVWAAALGTGDMLAFTVVCVVSGLALGADLALPGALLAGVIQRAGHSGHAEGAYFGWWNFATKLNLALAAGLALPLLGAFGYAPGVRDAGALQSLALAYGLLPCALKLLAAALLYGAWMRSPHGEPS
jgi:glycoside/pentoside/hexuronide:cation symporter, GPH family